MSNDRIEEAVLKIFRLTHMDRINWHRASPPRNLSGGTDSYFASYFEAEYDGQKLALFQERYQHFIEQIEDVRWTERVGLVLLSPDGQVLFEFPSNREVYDLLEAVRYKTSNIDGFLNNLLGKKP